MGEWVGRGRKARRCYGFDEIALVPGSVTINPNEVDTSWEIGKKKIRGGTRLTDEGRARRKHSDAHTRQGRFHGVCLRSQR